MPPDVGTDLACPHAATCGGCPLIQLPYEGQLDAKRARVARTFAAFPALRGLAVLAVQPAEPRRRYRTRAKLMVAPGGRLGVYAKAGDHVVVDGPGCIVLSPVLADVAAALRAMIVRDEAADGPAPLRPRPSSGGAGLMAVDLRELAPSDGGQRSALVTFVVARGPETRLEALRAAADALREAVPRVAGVAANFHETDSPQVLGSETLVLSGQAWGLDAIDEVAHRATFGSFVQAHRGQAARIHAAIAEAVAAASPDGSRSRVLDLYGGSGAIALALAARGAEVRMVESFAPAVQQALASARGAGYALTAECRDVGEALADLARKGSRVVGGAFDVAIVNPPRRGLDPDVRLRLAALPLRRIVYVSCQPETLARDLDHLARLGFAASSLTPFDMIPLTEEVETLAVLAPAPAPAPTVLYEDDEVVIVDKPPHEPTTPQGEHDSSLLASVRARWGSAAAAVHRLDVGTSGAVIFAKVPARVAAWSAALQERGEKVYVAAVRGVPSASGRIDSPLVIDGKKKQARTRFAVLREVGAHALVHVTPEEGRTHQIRRHLASIGHPILGDARYGHAPTNRFMQERHGLDRTFLHAERLTLVHPTTGRRLVVEAPWSGDLALVVESLERSRRRP